MEPVCIRPIPSLLQLSLKALISNLLFQQTSRKQFLIMSHDQQNTILTWEYEKILEQIPILCQSNEIHYELKKINHIHDLIHKILNHVDIRYGWGVIYGGFVRDYICSHRIHLPHDIDIKFKKESHIHDFVTSLSQYYDVHICDQVPKKYSSSLHLPRFLCSHCGCHDMVEAYDNNTVTMIVMDRKTQASIQMDLVHHIHNEPCDFDVNLLQMTTHGGIYYHTDVESIMNHIYQKQFVVLTSKGKNKLSHHVNVIDKNEYGITYQQYLCDGDCLCRHSAKGKKIQERIQKMKSRGWTVLNPPCLNPLCILSVEDHYLQYVKDMTNRQSLIEKEKEKLRKKEERQFKMFLEIEKLKYSEDTYGHDKNEKEIAIHRYRHQKSKTLTHQKRNCKHFRKTTPNKKKVWIDDDDYHLVKEWHCLNEEKWSWADIAWQKRPKTNIIKYPLTLNVIKSMFGQRMIML